MTTKYKIALGFICMIAILIVVSVLGYRYMSATLAEFSEYRRQAQVNMAMPDAETSLFAVSTSANQFLASFNNDFLKTASNMHQSSQALHELAQMAQELNTVMGELK